MSQRTLILKGREGNGLLYNERILARNACPYILTHAPKVELTEVHLLLCSCLLLLLEWKSGRALALILPQPSYDI